MPENITQIKLRFSCGENWDTMHPVEDGGRHCDQCHKVVYDFTNSKADEFRKILAENNYNVCGRFTVDQMAPKTFPFWKRWVTAAMVLIGFNTFSGTKADAQTKDKESNTKVNFPPPPTVLGDVETLPIKDQDGLIFTFVENMPEFPGGLSAFNAFIGKNVKLKEEISCTVTVQFIVEKNGALSNIRIVKGNNADINQEIITVLTLSPMWKPGIQNHSKVRVQYTMPIILN
jgi:hypothetical protein